MKAVIFDCNVYDLLAKDEVAISVINKMIHSGSLKVLVTRTIAEELWKLPFGGVPNFFPIEYTGNTVGRCGLMQCGDNIGSGSVFDAHLGTSNQVNDALIADAASWKAQWLVSEDARLRRRMARVSAPCRAISYGEFKEVVATWAE